VTKTAHIKLGDGRQIEYEIRRSDRAKNLRMKMTARTGLTVIIPMGLNFRQAEELVTRKSDWITRHFDKFDELRHLLDHTHSSCPEAFSLPAVAESWRVEYRKTKSKTVGARTDQYGRVVVCGAIEDRERCKAALRRWLARRAKDVLIPWLEKLAREGGFKYSNVAVRNQRTRWGSCSVSGTISLNAKLLFLSPPLVRYVLLHELSHTLEKNHSKRFWAHLRQFEPQTDLLHGQIRDAWKLVPAWAHLRANGDL